MRTKNDNLLEDRVDDLARRLREVEERLGELELQVTDLMSAERNQTKPYLTVREAALYVGVSQSMLAQWRCSVPGGPQFRKVGRRVLYSPEDLDKFLEEQCRSRPLLGRRSQSATDRPASTVAQPRT